jgi:hypothetical protein
MRVDRRAFGLGALGASLVAALPGRAATPLSGWDRWFNEGRYLPYFLEMKAQVEAGDRAARGPLAQFAAFLGDETTAIGLFEAPPDGSVARPDLTNADSQDAIEAIVERAQNARVVILNEAHNVSGHRGFATRVMRALREAGFDWLAAETFGNHADEGTPSIRAYRPGLPFGIVFGHYTADPVYAELVREAAQRGYRFAAYEQRMDQEAPEGADRALQIATREQAQAENLAAVLSANPEARVLVLVGYSHAMEVEGRGGTWFAARLKALTGIDPVTIEQSWNWPALDPANDAPHVAAVLERFQPTAPICIWNDGQTVATPAFAGRMDLSVFHPRHDRIEGRPGWLAADPERRAVRVEVPAFEGPALIQAMHMTEGPGGIPADQFLLEPGQREATLLLRPHSYFLRLETPSGFLPAWTTLNVEAEQA